MGRSGGPSPGTGGSVIVDLLRGPSPGPTPDDLPGPAVPGTVRRPVQGRGGWPLASAPLRAALLQERGHALAEVLGPEVATEHLGEERDGVVESEVLGAVER